MSRLPRRLVACLALFGLFTLACADLQDQLTDLPKLSKKDLRFSLAQSSKIYDAKGGLITTLHEVENRTIVPLGAIPKHVKDAVVAIEDERFYEHDGVDLRAILRALVANATAGEVREGGSTITQQLVKNLIIAPGATAAKTLERKITEAALSRQLEQRLTKKEILESYLNTVYFGEGSYGVQEAALTYFGVGVRKLTVPQGALLAALIRAPEQYNPYEKKKAARARRDLVIDKMVEGGWIEPQRGEKAKSRSLGLQPLTEKDEYPAPYFMDYVKRLITYDPRFEALGKTVGERQKLLFRGGLRIHTTIDMKMQEAAEQAVEQILPNKSDPHASLVAIDPNTGHVKAMVGGRDFFADERFAKLNLATAAEPGLACIRDKQGRCREPIKPAPAPGTGRQAGSAFKAFALAAAIDNGVSLAQTYKANSQIVFPGMGENGTDYIVRNYESSDFGRSLSVLDATVFSVNVVYAQLIDEIGPQAVADMAAAMGIQTPVCETCLSSALGSASVNPLDMASAYGTLATNGERIPPIGITKITDATGDVLYEDASEGEQVMEPQVAYLTTTALEQVIERGTAANYGRIGRPAAGKTGTAQEYRDAWFVGYTPDLVASVWVGYPEGQIEMKPSCAGSVNPCRPTRTLTGSGVTGGSFPTLIWARFMLKALAGVPASDFEQPSGGFVTVTIDTRKTNCLASELTPDEFKAQATFVAGTEPEKTCKIKGKGVEVPSVIGYPADEAEELLERNGFSVDTQTQETSSYPPGIVVGQDPDGGEKVPAGGVVTIYVSVAEKSSGSGGQGNGQDDDDTRTVPSVLGYSENAAESRLENEGFRVRVIYQYESNPSQARKNKGKVWKQSPSSGSEAEAGSTVTIWVNP